jgi:hypothetical protein
MNRFTVHGALWGIGILMTATNAIAEEISFDDMTAVNANCCYLTTEYADLGVTFVTTDDGSIWGGKSNGDPGTWLLEGTNGPAFIGFNGLSYSAQMIFDAPVSEFSLDMAPSGTGWAFVEDVFTLEGYLGGVLVDSMSSPPVGFAQWMTVALTGEIDEVVFFSSGPSGRNAYGIDNVQWIVGAGDSDSPDETTEPGPMMVDIDIKPRSARNFISPFQRHPTFVVVFGSEAFDVDEVETDSLAMGPNLAPSKYARVNMKDVNKDGFSDLVVAFRTRELGIAFGDTEACLSGATFDGVGFEGCDEIKTLPFHDHHGRRMKHGHHAKSTRHKR